jgi:hypothetical protein
MKRWKHRALILRGSTQGAFVCYNVEGLKHQTKASREHAHQDIMTTATIVAEGRSTAPHGPLGVLMLGALGVVYGDIGTSPLYTLKTALDWAGGATPATAIGMLSLIVWTLVINDLDQIRRRGDARRQRRRRRHSGIDVAPRHQAR